MPVNASILHVCGGDPIKFYCGPNYSRYSPRMWRWSYMVDTYNGFFSVFSTYVEVILILITSTIKVKRYSPRMWRWSWVVLNGWLVLGVFSTYVEVILLYGAITGPCKSILHVCGGDPRQRDSDVKSERYSPRMWRWSWADIDFENKIIVFSTYVEVILL